MSLEYLENPRKDGNHMGKCIYLLSKLKSRDKKIWREMNTAYAKIDLDDTWGFYQKLVKVYKDLPPLKQ